MPLTRGAFLHGGGAFALATAAVPRERIVTQLSWLPNVEYAGFFLAQTRGYFAKEKIAHQMRSGGPALPSVAAVVASGAADIGVDELDKVVDAVREGHDLVVLGAIYGRPVGGFLSLPQHPFVRAADLVGARVGLQSGGREYIDGILRLNALPLRYTPVAVGATPDALLTGACDVYLCYMTNQPLMLAERHIAYVARSLTDFGYFGYDGCLFCRRAELRARRPAFVRYLSAVMRGWQADVDDPDAGTAATLRVAPASLRLDPAQQRKQNRAQLAYITDAHARRDGILSVSRRGVERAYETLRAGGRADLPDMDALFDLTLLDQVHRSRAA